MNNYKHFNIHERQCIAKYLYENMSLTSIAAILDRSISSVSREIKRNSNDKGKYMPSLAQAKADEKQKSKKNHVKYDDDVKEKIELGFTLRWSPEQIVGFHRSKNGQFVCHKTVYRWLRAGKVAKGELSVLRRKGKPYKRSTDVNRMSGGKSIHDRPAEAQERSEIGHWELDTVVSGKGSTACLVTIVDRKSRFLKSKLLPNRTASVVSFAIQSLLQDEPVKTLTADNGKEFSSYELLETILYTNVYFADPYASWQRGTNENTNGLIREFIPKSCDIGTYTEEQLQRYVGLINTRPRKTLAYQTAEDVHYAPT